MLTVYVLTDLLFLLNTGNFPIPTCVPVNSELEIFNYWNIALLSTILEMTTNGASHHSQG